MQDLCISVFTTLRGSHADANGALFYHVEASCTDMPCPPYDAQKELNVLFVQSENLP